MKLLCLSTGKEVQVGDKIRCQTGILVDHVVSVEKIVNPMPHFRHGAIEFTITGDSQGNGPQQFPPRVFDCVWIGDYSLVTSVSFDNEHSVSHVIREAVRKMQAEKREVLTILIGEREWDQLRDLVIIPSVPSTGVAREPTFYGIRLLRLPHRDNCLALEHAPVESENGG